jgi:hypothetical protein
MSSNTTCDNSLVINPDISGIGVRCSFYLQTFLLVLLVDRSWQDAPSALWTFIATSFGLTLAALVQATQNQLSLFQALQVSNLVWLANFGTFLALASYSRRKSGVSHHQRKGTKGKKAKPENNVKFGAMFQTLFSMILTEWLWVHASTFGVQCSIDIEYILFVVKVKALGRGRIVALVLTSLLTVGYMAVTYHELISYYRSRKQAKKDKEVNLPLHHRKTSYARSVRSTEDIDDFPSPIHPTLNTNTLSPPAVPFSRSMSLVAPSSINTESSSQPAAAESRRRHTKNKDHRPRRRQWSGNWDPMLLGIAAVQIVVFTYFVVSSELLLLWNPHQSGGDSWGFGQILALIVIIPSALAVFNAFREHGIRRLHRRRKPKKGKSKQDTNPPIEPGEAAV